jgi:SIR2-like protein
MLSEATVDDLAQRLRMRRAPATTTFWEPITLFLGAGCASAAGVPSTVNIAREALDTFKLEDFIPQSESELLQLFYKHLDLLPPADVARMLQTLYARVPVPAFYQDLARMVRGGWFPLILTTSYDTLLEQALDNAGVPRASIRVTTLTTGSKLANQAQLESEVVNIVKLHGDLQLSAVQLSPFDIARALDISGRFVKSELIGDLIVVGHIPGDDPVDRFFVQAPDRELWWVNEQDASEVSLMGWALKIQKLHGEIGRPQVFFPQLALRLSTTVDDVETRAQHDTASVLLGEILRNQSALYSLDQEFLPSSRPLQVQTQIVYQKQQISRLEDKLRSLPDVKPHLFKIVNKILTGIQSSDLEPNKKKEVSHFLTSQIDTLKEELDKPDPNELIVSASLGAAVTLADRISTELKQSVFKREDLQELASFAPSAAGKVVF